MRKWISISILIMLLCISSASAAFVATDFERGSGVASVTGLTGIYTNTCADFSWNASTQTSDQNSAWSNQHYIVSISSNRTELIGDINTTLTRYTACTMAPGDWVKAIVYRVDGNSSGIFRNLSPDTNVTVNPGTMAQSGIYLMYNVLVGLAAVVSLLVLATIMALVFKKTGFQLKF